MASKTQSRQQSKKGAARPPSFSKLSKFTHSEIESNRRNMDEKIKDDLDFLKGYRTRTPVTTNAYRRGWEQIFGNK